MCYPGLFAVFPGMKKPFRYLIHSFIDRDSYDQDIQALIFGSYQDSKTQF
jgi:hypothetical protein